MTKKKTEEAVLISGKAYLRALAYALKAVPVGDDYPDLQHVTFIDKQIVGADGMLWLAGYLPATVPTMSVSRASAADLLMILNFGLRWSNKHSSTFSVRHDDDAVVVDVGGGLQPIAVPLQVLDLGGHPPTWEQPVAADAPINPTGHVECEHVCEISSWWRSWDKDYGTLQVRGGNGGPWRFDVVSNGERVAVGFALPKDHPKGELRDPNQGQLFDGRPPPIGKSNLVLDLTGDGRAYQPAPASDSAEVTTH